MRIYSYFLFLLLILFYTSCREDKKSISEKPEIQTPKPKPIAKIFGYPESEFVIRRDTIRKNDTFGDILSKNHLPYTQIYEITKKIKDSFNIKNLKTGKPYVVLSQKDTLDSIARPKVFIYQPDPVNYVVVDFRDSIKTLKKKRKVSIVKKTAKVNITKSLYQNIEDQNLSPKMAMELSNIYAWTVDFFHLNKGDEFKVIYDDVYIEDSIYVGVGAIHAAVFKYGKEKFYAFRYPTDSINNIYDYFDEDGKTLRKQFLKAPLKFGRISSRYNPRRFIKLYGRVKPHLGTDFAAPVGTPIMTTANGTVIKKAYTSANGNYIKIRHNSTYSTQYLHMSKFAKGIHAGSVVKQGDIIGYVGVTGNTTGPHVCYRFWKHGKQVDALKEKMPPAKPIDEKIKNQYLQYIDSVKKELDQI